MTIKDLIKYKIMAYSDGDGILFKFEYNSVTYKLILNGVDKDLKQYGKYHSYVIGKFLSQYMYNDKPFLEDILK